MVESINHSNIETSAQSKMSWRLGDTVFKELIKETFREAMPIHFLFKIESFSQLSMNSIVKLESNVFETGGYKWKLSLYPNGQRYRDSYGHISLYLELVDASLSDCQELNVLFRLFLFDHIRHRYFIRGGNPFPKMKKTVWGFHKFISIACFKEPANGFLEDDTCVFGAEVFVTKPPGKIECLSMVKEVTTVTHTWKIENFSNIKFECLHSDMVNAGGHNWDLIIYPQGNSEGKNNSVSLYLRLLYSDKEPGLQVYTNYKLRLRKQFIGKHIEFSSVTWFCASSESSGRAEFLGLDEMYNIGMGYLMNNACIVEAEVKVLGIRR